jgi:CheY-like chemotaxis protein
VTVLLPVPPLAADMAPSTDDAQRSPQRTVPDRTLLAGVRVMVVEDETDSRDILAGVLREWGAEVTTAASAPEALTAMSHRPPDVLVSDIGMPGMDGYDLIRELHKPRSDNAAHVPAIALTAYAGEESRGKALESGFDEHVAKPADPQQLLSAVARLAGRRAPP